MRQVVVNASLELFILSSFHYSSALYSPNLQWLTFFWLRQLGKKYPDAVLDWFDNIALDDILSSRPTSIHPTLDDDWPWIWECANERSSIMAVLKGAVNIEALLANRSFWAERDAATCKALNEMHAASHKREKRRLEGAV